MQYTAEELAGEIGISVSSLVDDYIVKGCPHMHDGDIIWVIGKVFRDWYLDSSLQPTTENPECHNGRNPSAKPIQLRLNLGIDIG